MTAAPAPDTRSGSASRASRAIRVKPMTFMFSSSPPATVDGTFTKRLHRLRSAHVRAKATPVPRDLQEREVMTGHFEGQNVNVKLLDRPSHALQGSPPIVVAGRCRP